MKVIAIKPNDINQRLDSFLRKAYPKLTLNLLYKAIRTKHIKVNHKKTTNHYRLVANDQIQIYLNDSLLVKDPTAHDFLLVPDQVKVVYEDTNIIIVDKPVGLVAHTDNSQSPDTLINRVRHYLANKHEWDYQNENYFTPSLVHRIDRNTNGLVLIAKNAPVLKALNQKIKQHQIEKYYWTKVHGKLVPPQSELNAFLTKISDNFVRISNKPLNANSKKIITAYKVLSYANHISTVEVKLVTGRTHQIRAHFAFIGYPLVGEKKYTTSQYSKLHSKIHQDLTACKLVFNFEPSDSILDYLSHKVFKI